MRKMLTLALFVLLSAQTKSTAAPAAYRCTGTEPFWSIDISPAGIVFQSPEDDPVTYPYSPPAKTGNDVEFTTALQAKSGKSTLQIVLVPGNCTDGMSESAYTHFAHVEKDGQKFSGCAVRANVREK